MFLSTVGMLAESLPAEQCTTAGGEVSRDAEGPDMPARAAIETQSVVRLAERRHDLLPKTAHGGHDFFVRHIAEAHLTQQVLHPSLA